MSQVVVKCIVSSLPFEEGEAYYAEAIQDGDEIKYSIAPEDPEESAPLIFNEASFKKHFLTLQHRASSGKKSYGGFKIESSAVVRGLLGTQFLVD